MRHDRVTDEDLERVAREVRSIRRREMLARVTGTAVGLALGAGLWAASYLWIAYDPQESMGYTLSRSSARFWFRCLLLLGGLTVGALCYRLLSPRKHPDAVE